MSEESSSASTSKSPHAQKHVGSGAGAGAGTGGSHSGKQPFRPASAPGAYYGSAGTMHGRDREQQLISLAKFLPYHKMYYGCINCVGIGDDENCRAAATNNDVDDDTAAHAAAAKNKSKEKKKNILFELRKLKSDDGMHHSGSELVGVSISDTYAHLRSTCLSFRPVPPTSTSCNGGSQNGNNAAYMMQVQCATGLTNGSLCVHSLDINIATSTDTAAAAAAASVTNHASLSFYPPKSARSCTAVAWRPCITKHVAVGLRSQRKMGRGDREFCCLVWDVEATHARTMLPASDGQNKAQAVHSGQAPIYRFAHNTDVASLAWLLDGNVLAVGTHQRIQLYDIRMAATNTPPTSSFAHNDVVSGIEMDRERSNIFATFSEGAGEAVKLWDTRRMDSPTSEIKTSTFACRDDLPIISSIKWSTLSSGTLAIASEDSIRTFDTLGNRPLLSRIMYSPSDLKCIAFQPSTSNDFTEKKSSITSKMIYPRRLLTVTSDRKVNATPKFQSAPLSISARDGRVAHSFGNAVWMGSASIGPSAIEKNVPSYDEDIAAVMMRRARCLHVASYSTDPASNLIMLSKEYSQDKSNGKADVSNNQQLWRLWNWIERVEFLCEDAYELEESGEQSLWPVKSIVDAGVTHLLQMDNEVDEGKKSESLQCITYDSSIRGAAMASCGWTGKDGLLDVLNEEEKIGNFERAAALAVFHGEFATAVRSLQNGAEAVREASKDMGMAEIVHANKYAEALQLVAMCIAGYNLTSEVWRSACKNLLSRKEFVSKDHSLHISYLRAACTFLCTIGVDGFSESIIEDKTLSLSDRVAFACRFLPRQDLLMFLDKCTNDCLISGNPEGILLTGLSKDGLSILQAYLDRSGDVQTAALVSSRAILPREWTNEQQICSEWLESYRGLLNVWQMWHSRSRFDVGRAGLLRRLKKREEHKSSQRGRQSKSGLGTNVHIPPQLYARCNFCNVPLSLEKLRRQEGIGNSWLSRQKPILSCCPQCRKPLPRCSICLLPLGCLNPYLELKRERNNIKSRVKASNDSDLSNLSGSMPFAEWYTWCMHCKHGGHTHHLVGWFKKYNVCPVSGCKCRCQFDVIKTLCRPAVTSEVSSDM